MRNTERRFYRDDIAAISGELPCVSSAARCGGTRSTTTKLYSRVEGRRGGGGGMRIIILSVSRARATITGVLADEIVGTPRRATSRNLTMIQRRERRRGG